MAYEPYQNCPCGSGKKLKWCCQKAAKYAEKAEQMLEKGQLANAMQALDEGLAVEPGTPLLELVKARVLLSQHDHEAAEPLIQGLLTRQPGNLPALVLRLQDQFIHQAVTAATATLQEMLDATPTGDNEETMAWFDFTARALSELDFYLAALQHFRVAAGVESIRDHVASDMISIENNANIAPWLRDSWSCRPAPSAGPAAQRWANAIQLYSRGRWLRAAKLFESVVAELPDNSDAWFNLGLCRASLAESKEAAEPLQRSAELDPDADRAAQTMALAICLDERESAQVSDVVQIRYPIRDQSRLIQRLKDHPRIQVHVLDAREGELEEGVKDEFFLMDKDSVKDAAEVTLANLPCIVGRIRNRGNELVIQFEEPAADDPRPRMLLDAAGDTIEPPGTRSVVATIPLSVSRMRRLWGMPRGAPPAEMRRIRHLVHEQSYNEVWPNTPLGWLDNQTALEAAARPEMKLRLRALMLLNEFGTDASQFEINLDDLRHRLGLAPEPMVDGDKIDLDHFPAARLRYVRLEGLSTPQLQLLFRRAVSCLQPTAVRRIAEALVDRPAEGIEFDMTPAYRILVELARLRADRTAALEWVARGRRWDNQRGLPQRPGWDILEWEVLSQFDSPADWAPRLAEMMTRFGTDQQATNELMNALLRVGLVRLGPHPTLPDRMVMDTRLLEMILNRYGTRQPGTIDLTPVGGAPGKLWTPGSQAGAAGPSIVLPGQEPPAKPASKLVIPGM